MTKDVPRKRTPHFATWGQGDKLENLSAIPRRYSVLHYSALNRSRTQTSFFSGKMNAQITVNIAPGPSATSSSASSEPAAASPGPACVSYFAWQSRALSWEGKPARPRTTTGSQRSWSRRLSGMQFPCVRPRWSASGSFLGAMFSTLLCSVLFRCPVWLHFRICW